MKILLLKQNILNEPVLNQGINLAKQYASTINLDLEFSVVDTTKQFTSIPVVNNIILNGHIVDPTEIFTEAKTFGTDWDCCLLVYDWTKVTPPQPTNPDDGGRSLQIPCQWFADVPQTFADFLMHELSHFLHQATNQPIDNTHLQFDPKWDGKFNQSTNMAYYLFLIAPLIALYKPETPQIDIILTRTSDNGVETLGTLKTADNQFGCDTLELPWKNNQQNISCIPKGIYLCKKTFMFSELAYHYELQNVPNRTGVFTHAGNFFFNSKGCILLGSQPVLVNGQTALQNSRAILSAFENKMGGKDFTLLIQ